MSEHKSRNVLGLKGNLFESANDDDEHTPKLPEVKEEINKGVVTETKTPVKNNAQKSDDGSGKIFTFYRRVFYCFAALILFLILKPAIKWNMEPSKPKIEIEIIQQQTSQSPQIQVEQVPPPPPKIEYFKPMQIFDIPNSIRAGRVCRDIEETFWVNDGGVTIDQIFRDHSASRLSGEGCVRLKLTSSTPQKTGYFIFNGFPRLYGSFSLENRKGTTLCKGEECFSVFSILCLGTAPYNVEGVRVVVHANDVVFYGTMDQTRCNGRAPIM